MIRLLRPAAITLSAACLLSGCEGPTHDETVLRAIKAESEQLIAANPITSPGYVAIPKSQWPSTIASLQPMDVTVFQWGVDIVTRPGFDGGWGYEVTRNKRDLPMPEKCYSEASPGVFWHGPC